MWEMLGRGKKGFVLRVSKASRHSQDYGSCWTPQAEVPHRSSYRSNNVCSTFTNDLNKSHCRKCQYKTYLGNGQCVLKTKHTQRTQRSVPGWRTSAELNLMLSVAIAPSPVDEHGLSFWLTECWRSVKRHRLKCYKSKKCTSAHYRHQHQSY